MPAKDVQTNLQLSMTTKGFDEGLRTVLGVNQKTLEGLKAQAMGYGKVEDTIKGLEGKIQELAKTQLEAHRAMSEIADETSDRYQEELKRFKEAEDQTRRFKKEADLLSKAHKEDAASLERMVRAHRELLGIQKKEQAEQDKSDRADRAQARGGFWQGMIQGTGIGGVSGLFMQRGAGWKRQLAGQLIGGALRRGGRGIRGALGGGVEGMQAALEAIPGVGSVAAAQLGQAAQNAETALQWQRQRVQLAPFFEGEMRTVQAGRRRLATGTQIRQEVREQAAREMAGKIGRYRAGEQIAEEMMSRPAGVSEEEWREMGGLAAARAPRQERIERVSEAAEIQKAGRREIRQAQYTAYRRAGELGREYRGLGRQEAAQEIGQLMQIAGGRFRAGRRQERDVGAALAAQTMFGVGPEAAGAFLQAGRRGGLVGGRGQAAEALTSALQDAVSLGLEGSEITRYMQQMAQGIMQFQATGIPVNKDSLKAMGLEFNKAGIGGVRGAAMAGGLQRYVQTIGQRGIGSGLDLMMMQSFGGFKGGGAADYEQAILQMEAMQGKGIGGIEAGTPAGQMIQRLVEMGGGARGGGVTFMRKAMGRAGVQMSMGEAMALTERMTGEKLLTEQQRKDFAIDVEGEAARRRAGKAPKTPEELMAAASRRIDEMGPNLRKQASLMDKQLNIGEGILTTVQTLKDSSLTLNQTFVDLAGPTLKDFAGTMRSFTTDLTKFLRDPSWSAWSSFVGKVLVGGT